MSHISKLTLSVTSPRKQLSPVERKRRNLIGKLDTQIAAAEAAVRDDDFVEEIKRWVRVEGEDDKKLVTKQRPVRPWWWTDDKGQVMVSLRLGNRILEIAPGKPAVEVGWLKDLPEVLTTLRHAIMAGELDAQIEKATTRLSDLDKAKPAKK